MEKERKRIDSQTFNKLEYIVSGSGLLSSEVYEIVDLMEEYADLARKEEQEKFLETLEKIKREFNDIDGVRVTTFRAEQIIAKYIERLWVSEEKGKEG